MSKLTENETLSNNQTYVDVSSLLLHPKPHEDKQNDGERAFIQLAGILHLLVIYPWLSTAEQYRIINKVEETLRYNLLDQVRGTLMKFFPVFWLVAKFLAKERTVTINQTYLYLKKRGIKVSRKSFGIPKGWVYQQVFAPLRDSGCVLIDQRRKRITVTVNEEVWQVVLGQLLNEDESHN